MLNPILGNSGFWPVNGVRLALRLFEGYQVNLGEASVGVDVFVGAVAEGLG